MYPLCTSVIKNYTPPSCVYSSSRKSTSKRKNYFLESMRIYGPK